MPTAAIEVQHLPVSAVPSGAGWALVTGNTFLNRWERSVGIIKGRVRQLSFPHGGIANFQVLRGYEFRVTSQANAADYGPSSPMCVSAVVPSRVTEYSIVSNLPGSNARAGCCGTGAASKHKLSSQPVRSGDVVPAAVFAPQQPRARRTAGRRRPGRACLGANGRALVERHLSGRPDCADRDLPLVSTVTDPRRAIVMKGPL
jgi:hypothetical protein